MDTLNNIKNREGQSPEFIQAVTEVYDSLKSLFQEEPKYEKVFEALVEPERTIIFRVPWEDDKGVMHINRGFRVQFSSILGPYKGGIRFHPSVNLSVIKFLGFEQIFKNSLTTLPMGAGKGGSDFDPKGKSDSEVRRFCQSFMTELSKHIGADTDVPAGDIGVGAREIGNMYGQYKRLRNESVGVLTGKNPKWGGSLIRPEATGYGAVYFANALLTSKNQSVHGKRCLVSGSGNVAQFCTEKILHLGGVALTMSDSTGTWYEPNGFCATTLKAIMDFKNVKRGRLSEFSTVSGKFIKGQKPWAIGVSADIAFPCATQNEIDSCDAEKLADSGVTCVAEGANMPSTADACSVYLKKNIILCPGKAANAGGVAVSGLEMSQNSQRLSWTREEVDKKLQEIMNSIFSTCKTYGAKYGSGADDLVTGANIGGFLKVADSMLELGYAFHP